MKRLSSRIAVCIFILFTTNLFSQTQVDTVFGPKKYVKNKGEYTLYTETFNVNIQQNASFKLRLKTGDKNWITHLTSGYIMLNGKKVINFLELNPLVQEFEKTVTLLKSNTLEIKLYGLQGSFITLTFLESYPKIDVTPPVLTITNPADGMLTNQKNLTTQGKVTDQSALTLTINGTSQPVLSDGTFSKAFTLAEGKNTLTFIASDSY